MRVLYVIILPLFLRYKIKCCLDQLDSPMFDGKPTIFVVHEEVIEVKGEDPVQRQVLEMVHDPVC